MVIKSHILRTCSPLARCLKSWHSSVQGSITWQMGRRIFQVENQKFTADQSGVHRGLFRMPVGTNSSYLPFTYEEAKIRRKTKYIYKAMKSCVQSMSQQRYYQQSLLQLEWGNLESTLSNVLSLCASLNPLTKRRKRPCRRENYRREGRATFWPQVT